MDAPRKRLAQMDPLYLEVVPHLGKRLTVGRRGDSLYKGIVPDGGQRARAWAPGLGNGRQFGISPLACTAENSMDLSALSKSPARFGMLARGRVSEDADGRLCESLAISGASWP